MIFIALGANLPSAAGAPLATCKAALVALSDKGVTVRAVSPWYRTEPQPPSDQPWFVNGVAEVATKDGAAALLARLHEVEALFGRERSVANAARPLDLDLLAYGTEVHAGQVTVPHPRLQGRAFVLRPWADLAPGWRHPILNKTVAELLAALPSDGGLERIPAYES